MRDYKKLDVWKKAHDMYLFVKKVISIKFPKDERYELTTQLLRAALSVPLNIAEGDQGRRRKVEGGRRRVEGREKR